MTRIDARISIKLALCGAFVLALFVPGSSLAQDAPVAKMVAAEKRAGGSAQGSGEGPAEASTVGCANASAVPHTVRIAATRRSTLCLLNIERKRRGLKPLKPNRRLRRAAARHARDMDRHNYFAHDSQGGSNFVDRIKRARYLRGARAWVVGENLAWGTSQLSTPRSIMRAWMNSPGHKANILNPKFREIGIGVSLGAPVAGLRNGATYATSFGSRRR